MIYSYFKGCLETLRKIINFAPRIERIVSLLTYLKYKDMIRIRLQKGLSEKTLIEKFGFKKITENTRVYYSKTFGPYEIQIKLSFPGNLRIQNFPDNRAPWILFRFLLELEAQHQCGDTIKFKDSGYWRILKIQDTLNLIEELSQYTDIKYRIQLWYKKYMKGELEISDE